jgi:hypothetical protein
MERLDQGCLHLILEVTRLTCHRRESNPGLRGGRRVLQKRAIRTVYLIAIRNPYMAAPVHVAVTHGLIPGASSNVV